MPQALLGVGSCGRCGEPTRASARCPSCGITWTGSPAEPAGDDRSLAVAAHPSPPRRSSSPTPAAGLVVPDAGDIAVQRTDDTGPTATADPAATEPSVGILLGNGERYEIFHALLLGRSPEDLTPGGGRALLAWPDLSRRLAKTHALFEWIGGVLFVTDLQTAGGTVVVAPDGKRAGLVPGVPTAIAIGATVECGGRSLRVVPGG